MQFRRDFRNNNQIRPCSAELGLLSEADGSCRFSQGQTSVIASIYGPSTPKYARLEEFDKACLEVEYSIPCGNSLSGPLETVAVSFLKSSISSCIALTEFPRHVIVVRVTVVRDDGCILSVALNACALALVDAGLPMKAIPMSISCILSSKSATLDADDAVNKTPEWVIQLDPIAREEQEALASFQGTFVSWGRGCGESGLADETGSRLLAAECTGTFTSEQLIAAVSVASTAAGVIKAFMRKLVENRSYNTLQVDEEAA